MSSLVLSVDPILQHLVNPRLPARTLAAEVFQDLGREPNGDPFLGNLGFRAAYGPELVELEGSRSDAHMAHAGKLVTPSASEADPQQRLKGSVEHYERPFDSAGDWGEGEDH